MVVLICISASPMVQDVCSTTLDRVLVPIGMGTLSNNELI